MSLRENKYCSRCDSFLSPESFYKDRTHVGGLQGYCIKCQKKWLGDNPERRRASRKRWNDNNIDKMRESRNKWGRKLKGEVYNAYGGYLCSCCGETEPLFLSIDHINNNGAEHRKEIKILHGGTTFYIWLKRNNYPKEFQILCYNCNHGKHLNGGVCPHVVEGRGK